MKKNKQIVKQNTFTEFLLYTTPNGKVKVEIFLRDENLWLTQKRMADLFDVGIPAINKHLKNIFESGELQEDSVISILEITAEDGKKYSTKFYYLATPLNLPRKRGRNYFSSPVYGEGRVGFPFALQFSHAHARYSPCSIVHRSFCASLQSKAACPACCFKFSNAAFSKIRTFPRNVRSVFISSAFAIAIMAV